MDRVGSLLKILMQLHGTNYCTSSARFSPSFVRQPKGYAPKWYKLHENVSLGSNGEDRVRSLQKIPMCLHGTNFCTSSARFAPSFVRQPKGYAPKQYETHQNVSLGSNGVDRVRSLRKIPKRLLSVNLWAESKMGLKQKTEESL